MISNFSKNIFSDMFSALYRRSRPEVFCKKSVLRNFVKFTGKHQCQILFFNKVAGLRSQFSCEFCEISKNTFYYKTPPVATSVYNIPTCGSSLI